MDVVLTPSSISVGPEPARAGCLAGSVSRARIEERTASMFGSGRSDTAMVLPRRDAGYAFSVPAKPTRTTVEDALAAGLAAAILSGVPSTAIALARGDDVLDGARAAGALLLPRERRTVPLLAAAVPVHLALSLGWAVVLSALLPARATVPAAVGAGLAIAALDLELVGRAFPRIRALPQGRQWADHVAYGLAVGAVVRRRRLARSGAR